MLRLYCNDFFFAKLYALQETVVRAKLIMASDIGADGTLETDTINVLLFIAFTFDSAHSFPRGALLKLALYLFPPRSYCVH